MDFIKATSPAALSGLNKLIGNIITSFTSVALGIIIFTIGLKLLTLVFDYISRASMRRSSLKMKEMRPQLEKLQVQFKDNKQLYQEKVMALYKKEGYSVFSSCLPTIITLVIFIIVLNSFQRYSEFQNKKDIFNMAESYNSVILDGFEYDNNIVKKVQKDGRTDIEIDFSKLTAETGEVADLGDGKKLICQVTTDGKYEFYTTNGYSTVIYSKASDGSYARDIFGVREGTMLADKFPDWATYKANNTDAKLSDFLKNEQAESAAKTYINEREGFFWIKNIWVQDRADKNPIVEYKDVKNLKDVISEADYAKITANLSAEKDQANGYYILVALTILVTLGSQIIMMRGNKDQMELQTVDGQGAQTQKMMLWMMPIMMAIFAFIYTSAFSLYIITSSLLSTITTIAINKIVDFQVNKKNEQKTQNIIRRG